MELDNGDVLLAFVQTGAETGGEVHVQEGRYAPHSKPPPYHCHPAQDERFQILEGGLTFHIDGVDRQARTGDEVHVPRGAFHYAYNPHDQAALVLWETRPALRTAEFFATMNRAMRGRAKPRLRDAAAILREYRHEFVLAKPPALIQRVVFGCLAPFGRAALAPLVLAVLALIGCGGGGGSGADGGAIDAGATADARPQDPRPDFSHANSRIAIGVNVTFDYAQLSGFFADGPPVSWQEPAESDGNCRIVRFAPSTCSPACSGEEICVGGTCLRTPRRVDRGALMWTWPDGMDTVAADGVRSYFAEGGATRHGLTSIEVDGISLELPTATQPMHDGDWAQLIESRAAGADVALRWTNPTDDARVRLHMTDCTGSHGGIAAAELECEGPDTGELVVPGALLDIMVDADWSRGECGSHRFERYHRAVAPSESMRLETVGDGGFFWRPGF
jgi:quercetin dioxygenase-like cupin family protein